MKRWTFFLTMLIVAALATDVVLAQRGGGRGQGDRQGPPGGMRGPQGPGQRPDFQRPPPPLMMEPEPAPMPPRRSGC